jgi:hypothetical protein
MLKDIKVKRYMRVYQSPVGLMAKLLTYWSCSLFDL